MYWLSALPISSPPSIVLGDEVRISSLSRRLVRVEPRGPRGFEDAPTFGIAGREALATGGPALRKVDDATVASDDFVVRMQQSGPVPSCAAPADQTDVSGPRNANSFPEGARAEDVGACCDLCDSDPTCVAWVFGEDVGSGHNCWPLAGFDGLESDIDDRSFGCGRHGGCPLNEPHFTVHSPGGALLFNSSTTPAVAPELLHWPSPLSTAAYALMDYPRFTVPPWGPAPIPPNATVDPELAGTHGYDFRNNVRGDLYVFLLGGDLDGWAAARSDVVALTGPCPRLPDFAFGTWFTYWHAYSEAEAKDDIAHWEKLGLPIDVWGLDMNWRNTSDEQDRYYDHPNTGLFANFTEWFGYLREHKLRTYFNDHPFPVGRSANHTH